MASYKSSFYFIAIFTVLYSAISADEINSDLKIKNVDRTIDISTQLVKNTARITFENTGKSVVNFILLSVDPTAFSNLAFINAKEDNRDVKITPVSVASQSKEKFWRVTLKNPLNAGSTAIIVVDSVYTKSLIPHPSSITQQEQQLVKYFGNAYYYSPYPVVNQKTSITLSTKQVESYTKVKPTSQSDATITYGPYSNVKPFSSSEVIIHYKNNAPFLTVSRIERVIEVSHWGNIAIEETIEIYHSGAKLEGPFSRYDYQQDPHSAPSSVKSYKTLLPASASDAYYRDTNGNISTSHTKVKKDAVELDLRPRYPLFGGWKTHYTLGYNVPSYEYLFNSGSDFLLKLRLVDHIFDDMFVEELVTKIILPEGSANVKLSTPYPVTRLADTLHYTYLDTKGRPVISFTKTNLVENHIQDFQLRYTFPRILMVQEPLLVVGFIYAMFLCVIVYVRLDFSIHKDETHKD